MSGYGQWLPTSALQGKRFPLVWTNPGGSGIYRSRCLRPCRKSLFQAFGLCRDRVEAFRPLNCRNRSILVRSALNSDADSIARGFVKKRGIVEHIFLLKAKADISEEEEKNMLDYLYTTQYQMRGILAISLGRIVEANADGFTHAVYMRFQKKEDLQNFYRNAGYLSVLNEYVIPYCYGSDCVDYESDVEDDILPIFRKGEEFNYGVEFFLMISVSENAAEELVNEALTEVNGLVSKFSWLIVQSTFGTVFSHTGGDYTHAAVIRFPSVEALQSFRGCSDYKELWRRKLPAITRKAVAVHFPVDPVGTDLM